jgi:hypothetical protein
MSVVGNYGKRVVVAIHREYLGIYAKARGMFYYRGRTTPIDFDAIDELASDGAVNVVIEKEGVPAVLEPYSDKSV